MSSRGAAIDFERSDDADKAAIDVHFASGRQQHGRGELTARQAALKDARHHVGMATERLAALFAGGVSRNQDPDSRTMRIPQTFLGAPYQAVNQRKIRLCTAAAHIAVFVEIEDADVGHIGSMKVFVKVAGNPFQVRPAAPKAVDPGRVQIDADKPARFQDAFTFKQIERQHPGGAHQLAPIAAQAESVPSPLLAG